MRRDTWEGVEYADVLFEEVALDGSTSFGGRCAVRYDEATEQVESMVLEGTCGLGIVERNVDLGSDSPSSCFPLEPGEVLGQPLEARSHCRWKGEPIEFGVIEFGLDIGVVVEHTNDVFHPLGGDLVTTVLMYAHVGGVTYGFAPVANEPAQPSTPLAALAVYPNPTFGSVTLELALPASADLEVLDVLGRRVREERVPAGASEHRLDLREVPPGLYVVRVTTDAGETTARRLVKVD